MADLCADATQASYQAGARRRTPTLSAVRNQDAVAAETWHMNHRSGPPRPWPTHAPRPTSHAHVPRPPTDAHADAHALADAHDAHQAAPGPFPHDKLDAYRVALEMAALAHEVAAQIPRGHRTIADHLLRAASHTVLLLAEGANRRGAALKRQRFNESRGESGEVAAAADLLVTLKVGDPALITALRQRASRVSAMLTRLIGRLV